MSKPRLAYAWASSPVDIAPAALLQAAGKLPEGTRYLHATVGLDTPCQHTVHLLHVGASGLVTWTGRGVKLGAIVATAGGVEAIKRRIEGGQVSTVPRTFPLRGGPAGKATRKPRMAKAKPELPGARPQGAPAPVPALDLSRQVKR